MSPRQKRFFVWRDLLPTFTHDQHGISLHKNLRLSNIIRAIVIALVIAMLMASSSGPATLAMVITLVVMAVTVVFTSIRLGTRQTIGETEFLSHLLLDTMFLTLLFGFSGGPSNPFVSFYLLPVIISASTLNRRSTIILLVVTLSAYSGLFILKDPVSGVTDTHALHSHEHHLSSLMQTDLPASNAFAKHLFGMWLNFAICAVLISTFVVNMRARLVEQQTKINEQRENTLRDERVIAIATQSANMAHHLGTPLSTMAVIVNDLKQDESCKNIKDDIELIEKQIATCKRILAALRNHTDKASFENLHEKPVEALMADIIDELQLLHPRIRIETAFSEGVHHELLNCDYNIKLALLSLINNACEACKVTGTVKIRVDVTNSQLLIHIQDSGSGIPDHLEGSPRTLQESTKKDGLGLGLFLSHATLNRYGGTIKLAKNTAGAGTITEISLPRHITQRSSP